MNGGVRRTPRHARGGLPAPGLVVRRGLHRADQFPVRTGRVRGPRWRRGDDRRGTPLAERPGRPAGHGGSRAVVVVRPEHVRLSPTEPPAGDAGVPVTVLDEVFQGSVVRYQLQGPGTSVSPRWCRWTNAPTSTRASRRGHRGCRNGATCCRPRPTRASSLRPTKRCRLSTVSSTVADLEIATFADRQVVEGTQTGRDAATLYGVVTAARGRSGGTRPGGGHGRGRPSRRARSNLQRPRCRAAHRQGGRSGVDVPGCARPRHRCRHRPHQSVARASRS